MYKKILVALENGPADEVILPQVAALAGRYWVSELLLLHVADVAVVARNFSPAQARGIRRDENRPGIPFEKDRQPKLRAQTGL